MVARSALGSRVWGVAASAVVVAATFACAVIGVIATRITRRATMIDRLGPIWGKVALTACGARVEVHGLEHLDRSRSYVIISNHLSNFDVLATFAALPVNLRFVAKQELTKLPFFGQALKLSEHVVIDRSHPDEAIARINARVARRGSAPFCILFYAEGTRSPDGRIHAFKKGGVNLAIRTGLPVLPLTISGSWKFWPKNSVLIRPGGRIKITLSPPIDTGGYSIEQRDELNERVRAAIVANFDEHC